MPLLSIELNQPLEPHAIETLLSNASQLVSGLLNKPRRYMMVRHHFNTALLLGTEPGPTALMELKSIDLPDEAPRLISPALCALLERHTGIPGSRVYLLFTNIPRQLWGHDSTTF